MGIDCRIRMLSTHDYFSHCQWLHHVPSEELTLEYPVFFHCQELRTDGEASFVFEKSGILSCDSTFVSMADRESNRVNLPKDLSYAESYINLHSGCLHCWCSQVCDLRQMSNFWPSRWVHCIYKDNKYFNNFIDLLIIIHLTPPNYIWYPRRVCSFSRTTLESLLYSNGIELLYKSLLLQNLCFMLVHERLCIILRNRAHFTCFDVEFYEFIYLSISI